MMAADLVLRQATSADAGFLLAVYASTRLDELAPTGWDGAQMAAFLRQQFEAQDRHYRLHFPGARFHVVCLAGRAVGRLYVDHAPGEIRVLDIALLPQARGHGVGRALLSRLLGEARDSGADVTLHVERQNPARRLYERLGFVEHGGDEVYLAMRWTAASLPGDTCGGEREAAPWSLQLETLDEHPT